MDYSDLIVGLISGLLGYLSRRSRTVTTTVERTLAVDNRPDKLYVRFHFADGRVEVRKFDPALVTPKMTWKGRPFRAGKWTPDGHIYTEIVNGR